MARRFRNASGPRIRKARDARGWTQEDLAAKLQLAGLDFDRVTVAKVESQIRTLRDFELIVIAHALGVSMEDLAGGFDVVRSDLDDLQRGERG